MIDRLSQKRSEEGFTLIELLIVIIILGILAAVVVFAVGGIDKRGENSACKSDVKTLETASEAYNAKNGSYAATGQALVDGRFIHSLPNSDKYAVAYVLRDTVVSAGTARAGDAVSAAAGKAWPADRASFSLSAAGCPA